MVRKLLPVPADNLIAGDFYIYSSTDWKGAPIEVLIKCYLVGKESTGKVEIGSSWTYHLTFDKFINMVPTGFMTKDFYTVDQKEALEFAMQHGYQPEPKVINLADEHKDNVNHPSHYNQMPNGIEAIDVCEHMNFNRGNAIKYIWRAGHKNNEQEDLHKALFYIEREILRLESLKKNAPQDT